MTESNYNNNLAGHHEWSTIKTLPATLPEPSFAGQEPTLSNIATGTSALGPRPGLLEPFFYQLWTLLKGVGLRMVGLASRIGGLLDWLADLFFP